MRFGLEDGSEHTLEEVGRGWFHGSSARLYSSAVGDNNLESSVRNLSPLETIQMEARDRTRWIGADKTHCMPRQALSMVPSSGGWPVVMRPISISKKICFRRCIWSCG
jgi:hypothetical protein